MHIIYVYIYIYDIILKVLFKDVFSFSKKHRHQSAEPQGSVKRIDKRPGCFCTDEELRNIIRPQCKACDRIIPSAQSTSHEIFLLANMPCECMSWKRLSFTASIRLLQVWNHDLVTARMCHAGWHLNAQRSLLLEVWGVLGPLCSLGSICQHHFSWTINHLPQKSTEDTSAFLPRV